MSLIHTAELNGVAPFEYLVAVLRNHAPAAVTPAAWMPWNYRSAPRPSTTLSCRRIVKHAHRGCFVSNDAP